MSAEDFNIVQSMSPYFQLQDTLELTKVPYPDTSDMQAAFNRGGDAAINMLQEIQNEKNRRE